MKLIIVENYEEASQKAADIMLEVVKNKPTANLGLATGSTPIKMYELMVKDHKENGTSYQDINILCRSIYFQVLILNLKISMYQVEQGIFKKTVMNIIKC